MQEFINHYGVFLLLLGIGLLLIIVSIAAGRAGRSGVPLVGGLLIIIGGLTTPTKLLALLGLLDYGFWMFPCVIISDRIKNRRFRRFMEEKGFGEGNRDPSKILVISIPERDEIIEWPYITAMRYQLQIPKLSLAVCTDEEGRCILLADRSGTGRSIEILPFPEEGYTFTGLSSQGREMTVEITVTEIKKDKNNRG